MQDATNQPLVNLVASSLSNAQLVLPREKRGQLDVMTTSFIQEQIDIGLNDLMPELFKQLANIIKPMVHNKIQMA